jgi:hypothetical protein
MQLLEKGPHHVGKGPELLHHYSRSTNICRRPLRELLLKRCSDGLVVIPIRVASLVSGAIQNRMTHTDRDTFRHLFQFSLEP